MILGQYFYKCYEGRQVSTKRNKMLFLSFSPLSRVHRTDGIETVNHKQNGKSETRK